MKIGTHDLDEQALLIAEIGMNHGGDFAKARDMVRQASEAGADAAKFQAYYPSQLRFVSPSADKARFDRQSKNELSWDQFRTLADDCAKAGVLFLCSCFDVETVSALADVLPAYKVASGDLTNDELLEAVAATGKPVILSTGMSSDEEIDHAVAVIRAGANGPVADRLVLLQCTGAYPCPPDQVHLRAMAHLAKRHGVRVGYSDHTEDLTACTAALALGARVIEKHFIDARGEGPSPDIAISAESNEFRELVRRARLIEGMLGREEKTVQPNEAPVRRVAHRSMGVRRDLAAGTVLAADMLIALRPAAGWPVRDRAALVGRVLARPLTAGDLVHAEDLRTL